MRRELDLEGSVSESVIHILRDCYAEFEVTIWQALLPWDVWIKSQNMPLKEWVSLMNGEKDGWGANCSRLWKWRNALIFSNEYFSLGHKLIFLYNQWKETRKAFVKLRGLMV